jgi:hypothetical protein
VFGIIAPIAPIADDENGISKVLTHKIDVFFADRAILLATVLQTHGIFVRGGLFSILSLGISSYAQAPMLRKLTFRIYLASYRAMISNVYVVANILSDALA